MAAGKKLHYNSLGILCHWQKFLMRTCHPKTSGSSSVGHSRGREILRWWFICLPRFSSSATASGLGSRQVSAVRDGFRPIREKARGLRNATPSFATAVTDAAKSLRYWNCPINFRTEYCLPVRVAAVEPYRSFDYRPRLYNEASLPRLDLHFLREERYSSCIRDNESLGRIDVSGENCAFSLTGENHP